uniref:Uncharacterized protein n=1 Tax=Anguilla anguilla TaxID=7936 RepID=A0A0E9SDL6_ANGAN
MQQQPDLLIVFCFFVPNFVHIQPFQCCNQFSLHKHLYRQVSKIIHCT